jgi:hypothetical protein
MREMKRPGAPTTQMLLRDVDIGTAKVLDDLARDAGQSRNTYINMLLDRIARDSAYNPYNRDNAVLVLQKVIPLLEQTRDTLMQFNTYFEELKAALRPEENEGG